MSATVVEARRVQLAVLLQSAVDFAAAAAEGDAAGGSVAMGQLRTFLQVHTLAPSIGCAARWVSCACAACCRRASRATMARARLK